MYDTGLRVGELVQLDVELLRNNNSELYLPTGIQKDYSNENSPPPATFELADDTARLLSAYLTNRWKDTQALFPARSSDRISEQGVRNMLHKIAEEAEVRPYQLNGSSASPNDADYDLGYFPGSVTRAYRRIRWFETDDFSIQYLE